MRRSLYAFMARKFLLQVISALTHDILIIDNFLQAALEKRKKRVYSTFSLQDLSGKTKKFSRIFDQIWYFRINFLQAKF